MEEKKLRARTVGHPTAALRFFFVKTLQRSPQIAGGFLQTSLRPDLLWPQLIGRLVEILGKAHLAQCINYLKASGLHLALLINFHRSKVEWRRVVHEL